MFKQKNNTLPSRTNQTRNHCEICDETIIGGSHHFKSHLFKHGVIKPRFQCKHCPRQYFRTDTYLRHMKSHKGNYCKICDKTVIGSSYKFNSHLFKHGVIKPRFECKYCPRQFFRSDTFERHMKSHEGTQKKYICDYCGRSFVDKRNLIYHFKVHDDSFHGRADIQFKCDACGVFYCENRLLQHHIRREHFNLQVKEIQYHKKNLNETWVEAVSDTKNYVKMTKVNNNVITIKKCVKVEHSLNKVKTHDLAPLLYSGRQYAKGKCDYCNKEMLKKSLRLHIQEKHLNVRKFNCETCKRSFKRHYQLVDHECGKIRRRKRRNKVAVTGHDSGNKETQK